MVPDSFPGAEFSSVAGVGFALTSYPVGIENHYITRAQGAQRTLATLDFLLKAPQNASQSGAAGYKGFFYHFLSMDNGLRYGNSELSTIDTALLMAGVLSSGTYFNGASAVEARIRADADALYRRVDWPWAYSGMHKPLLSMGWTPGKGFINYYWTGYSEAMILYILAMGSPSHPIAARGVERVDFDVHVERSLWISTCEFRAAFRLSVFPGVDRFSRHKGRIHAFEGIDYFINSRRAAYAGRAYCIENPDKWQGYGDLVWGLTASDGPGRNPTMEDPRPSTFHAYWARALLWLHERRRNDRAHRRSRARSHLRPRSRYPRSSTFAPGLENRSMENTGSKMLSTSATGPLKHSLRAGLTRITWRSTRGPCS